MAMNLLAGGLGTAGNHEDALTVLEAELSMLRRLGDSGENMLISQSNLANAYLLVGREDRALHMRQEVYSGRLMLLGEEHRDTHSAAINYGSSLMTLGRFEEARTLLRKTMPVMRRTLGDNDELTLNIRWGYAQSLYKDPSATLDDLREAVETLADAERIARRVFGGTHPLLVSIERNLRRAQETLRAREPPNA